MANKSVRQQDGIFRQLCELIPSHLVPKLARKHQIKSRAINPKFGIGKLTSGLG